MAAVGVCAALSLTPALAGARSHAVPVAHAAKTCGVGSGRGYGYSYLTWLWTYRTSCSAGKSLAKKHGHARGWSCHRKVLDHSPVQYDAKVTCKSGGREIAWTYTQNT
jgi:hypothetical protein